MIVKSVLLRCDPQRAFTLFTELAGLWWPADRRHTDDTSSEIRFEQQGRFFERASDGTEVELGVVRTFAPGKQLIVDWYPGTGRESPTQVEVLFEAADGGTRVTILHAPGIAGSETFGRNAPAYAGSWDFVLAAMSRFESGSS